MKNSLWAIVAVVIGVVGFLVGYSVQRPAGSEVAVEAEAAPPHADAAPAPAPAQAAEPAPAATAAAEPAAAQPAAAGYGAPPVPGPAVPAGAHR